MMLMLLPRPTATATASLGLLFSSRSRHRLGHGEVHQYANSLPLSLWWHAAQRPQLRRLQTCP